MPELLLTSAGDGSERGGSGSDRGRVGAGPGGAPARPANLNSRLGSEPGPGGAVTDGTGRSQQPANSGKRRITAASTGHQ